MSSNEPSDRAALELDTHVPTTRTDVDVLRRLRRETPSWLSLSAAEVEALLRDGALDGRPPTSPQARPFVLPDAADGAGNGVTPDSAREAAIARLLAVVPDEPEWVDVRGMLLTGRAQVTGERDRSPSASGHPQGIDEVACVVKVLHGAVSIVATIGRPGCDALLGAVEGATDMTPVVVRTADAGWAEQCLNARLTAESKRWVGEPMIAHCLRHGAPGAPSAGAEADVRLLAPGDSLAHLPPGLRHEITHARTFAPVAAVFVDDRPVSFCYPVWRTETLWDVSIDTLEAYRGRGLAAAAVRFMIDHLRRDRLEPVWCALESNSSSLKLAAKLGFEPVGSFVVFSRGSWAILTAGFAG